MTTCRLPLSMTELTGTATIGTHGNALPGKAVSLGQSAGSSTIAPASAVTNGSGDAAFTVKSTTAETVTYTATDTTDSAVCSPCASEPAKRCRASSRCCS